MKKMVLSCLALSILSTLNVTLAAESVKPTYRVKIPLEISNGGRLPNGSIIIGTGNNNGSGGNTGGGTTDPTNPTDPSEPTDCSYDLSTNTAYAEGVSDSGVFLTQKVYNGEMISNGVKGKLQMSVPFDDQQNQFYGITNGSANYYELCLNGETPQTETPIIIAPIDQWESGECRFGNGYGDGYNYSFTQVSGSNDEEGDFTGKQLFTDTSVGQWGSFHFTDTNYTKPYTGYVNTSYGQYQYENEGISLGSVYFFKGSNLQSTSTDANGRTVSNYDVCLYIVN